MNVNVTYAEVVTPGSLEFCVDADWLGFLIAIKVIKDGKPYDDVTDEILRTYLEKRSKHLEML